MWPTHYIPRVARKEAIPPPTYYLTTPPYPVEVTEALLGSGDFDRGRYGIGAHDELMSSGAAVGGLLRDILRTHDQPPEDELLANGRAVGGALRVALVTTDAGHEELLASGRFVSGVLRDPLIPYLNWPLGVAEESLIGSGAPVNGVLA